MAVPYKSPEVNTTLSKEEIHKRFQDTAKIIFQEEQDRKKELVNYLSIGNSRKTIVYSNNGNDPVIIRRPADYANAHSSQTSQEHHKPNDCMIT
ncbi:uncharacterized protein LOC105830063 [Monomorium pharaonis]|uniref:uncharacterized protein LOC105830063 n=1 Tax=Monomorium pharaonis TaxID=307658 RepID=UPI00063FCDD2|nr:uncharacterized protein LOC105830063 [Monomorium pharaonis]XP_012524655.1 uncharacterized protein LOC105830063 [Monomorium pharaonis]XP_012524656.1 uncharacterized protein LOC105830063 [Monomorium pharaonis]XP_012524657.1 uncharacterized protein LOC105830063 [Monomorium pharaonis]XP_012524658.1 uncharacterized protein LOC105830063 [Monomorium pharaonis]XP_012524660.1 uncharacterized protein LOC105830063 [Monomorium pharaonis]